MTSGAGGPVEVVFHVGLHKTGTTWLQKRVFVPEQGQGIAYSQNRDDLRGVFSRPRHDAFSPQAARAALAPILEEARRNGRVAVLSDEALAGFAFGDRFRQAVTLERIAATFPDAGLLVTVREQVRILHSIYGHYMRGGGTASLENFLRQPPSELAATWDPVVDLDYYDYTRLLQYCQRLFAPGRVVMVPMEWMLKTPEALYDRLHGTFGINWSTRPPEEAGSIVNPAWSDLGYAVNRQLNHFKTGQPRWEMGRWRLKPNGVAARIDKLTPKALRARQKARQLARISAAVGDRYAASNRALSDALKIDLGAFGYHLG